MIVAAVTCTRGRHTLLERCVGLFLKQDYEGVAYQIIFNNAKPSRNPQRMAKDYNTDNKKIILVNQPFDSRTGERYSSINQIFENAMMHVSEEVEVVTFFDDDDIFLPNHLSEGVKGYKEAREQGMWAYKPYHSLIQTTNSIEEIHNMCEPSVFVNKEYVNTLGFSTHSAAYHHQWLNPLIREGKLYEPIDGTPTFVYQWVGGCYHISGDGENPKNLENHNRNSTDEGDGIITPIL